MEKFYSRFVSKKVLIVLLSFICVGRLWADTPKSGIIGTETWNLAGSPYVLAGTVTVTGTLTIEPGVTVSFPARNAISQGAWYLDVQPGGKIIAKGTADSLITFQGNGVALDGEIYRRNQCGPVVIESGTLPSVLQYVVVDQLGTGYEIANDFTGAIAVKSNSCSVSDCIIKNTRGVGVLFTDFRSDANTPTVSNNSFVNNTVGMKFTNISPLVNGNKFSGNVNFDVITELDNLHNLVDNDPAHIGLTYNLIMALNDRLSNHNYDYTLLASLNIFKALTIDPNVKVIFPARNAISQGAWYIDVSTGGKIIAKGTADSLITFQGNGAALDGEIYRRNQCGPVVIEPTSLTSALQYVVVDQLGTGYEIANDFTGAIAVKSNSCSVSDCIIKNTRGVGIWFDNSSTPNTPTVSNNRFINNTVGMKFTKNSPLVNGNKFSGNVNFDVITELDNLHNLVDNDPAHIGLTYNLTMALDDTLSNYNYDYTLLAILTVPTSNVLTIDPGVTVIFPARNAISQGAWYLDIAGKLLAKGTADAIITFQGNGPGLDGEIYRRNQCGPVVIESTSSNSTFEYVLVDQLGTGYEIASDLTGALIIRSNCTNISNCIIQNTRGVGIVIQGVSPYIAGSFFNSNRGGIFSSTGEAKVSYCNFVSNSAYGLKNNSTTDTVFATNCFWNSILGPTEVNTNPVGGDIASDYVLYSPWLTDQYDYTTSITPMFPDCATGILPLTLINFQTTLSNNAVNCTWQTATETNTSYFIIQRSTDGANFTSLGKVYASGNSSTNKSYSFTDKSPNNGINYYRLQMVDKDGKYSYSKTLPINISIKQPFTIYPNPVKDVLYVQVQRSVAEQVSLLVIDMQGKMIAQQSRQFAAGVTTLSVNTTSLAKGSYFVVIKGQTTDKKLFIKE